jgi:hypothetical protein
MKKIKLSEPQRKLLEKAVAEGSTFAVCEHYILCIMGVTKDEVSEEDQKRLDELGFTYLDDACGEPGWASFKFGSA